jgi:hypothetical protein
MTTTGAQPPKLPDGIEIFAAGTRTDDAGNTHTITEADLAACAAAYDPALHEAPLCVGHPANDKPAYGWVARAAVQPGGRLVMDTKDVDARFAELVQTRKFSKRSTAFYSPTHPHNPKPGVWYLRHVAFLGAEPPAVKGLRDIQFSEEVADLVFFSESTPTNQEHTMTPEEIAALKKKADDAEAARLAAEKDAAESKAKLTQFSEQQTQARRAGDVQFAEAQIAAGRLLPKDKDALLGTLAALDAASPVEFSEGGQKKTVAPADFVKGLIAAGKPVVQFGEHAPGSAGGTRLTKESSDAEVDKAAKAYAADKKVSYAEAVAAVTAHFTTAA